MIMLDFKDRSRKSNLVFTSLQFFNIIGDIEDKIFCINLFSDRLESIFKDVNTVSKNTDSFSNYLKDFKID